MFDSIRLFFKSEYSRPELSDTGHKEAEASLDLAQLRALADMTTPWSLTLGCTGTSHDKDKTRKDGE